MELAIRPMTPQERMYSYSQSTQIEGQAGCIGHLRGDLDGDGEAFLSSWTGHRDDLKTQDFKDEFDDVINALRFDDQYGGIMVHQIVAGNVLSGAAIKCGFTDGSYLCFEEDCDAQVVLRELMDRKLYQAPVNEHYPPGKYESVIDASVQRNHPEYWAFRKRHLLPALQNNHKKSNKERER